jgi:hypothetical protein
VAQGHAVARWECAFSIWPRPRSRSLTRYVHPWWSAYRDHLGNFIRRSISNPPIFRGELATRFDRGGRRFALHALVHYATKFWPDFSVPKAVAVGHPGICEPNPLPSLCELVDRFGDVLFVTHSQGAYLCWQLALAWLVRIRANEATEPAQTVSWLSDLAFPKIPVCVIWRGNLPQTAHNLSKGDLPEAGPIAAVRPFAEVDHPPEISIAENGQMLMKEDNSTQLQPRAKDWLRRRLLDYRP